MPLGCAKAEIPLCPRGSPATQGKLGSELLEWKLRRPHVRPPGQDPPARKEMEAETAASSSTSAARGKQKEAKAKSHCAGIGCTAGREGRS